MKGVEVPGIILCYDFVVCQAEDCKSIFAPNLSTVNTKDHGIGISNSYSVLNRAERPKVSLMGFRHRSGPELLIAQALRGSWNPQGVPKYVSSTVIFDIEK